MSQYIPATPEGSIAGEAGSPAGSRARGRWAKGAAKSETESGKRRWGRPEGRGGPRWWMVCGRRDREFAMAKGLGNRVELRASDFVATSCPAEVCRGEAVSV